MALGGLASDLGAQGVTTAAIQGVVRSADGSDVDGARVEVVNDATGFRVEGEVRHGRFLVQGLEIGGPYTIEVERLGFRAQRIEGLFLRLGEPGRQELILDPAPIPVDTLRVRAAAPFPHVNTHGGTATTISDSVLHRLPTLNRNLYDFVRLVPQVSTRTGLAASMSGGGVGLRFNDFLINGASERTLSGGLTSNQGGGKSVPLEAVREYQVLLAPYDVRFGDFAGALVNTVTRSGTNTFEGSAFAYWRNDHLARGGELAPAEAYDQVQYGFSLGGPIVRDRLHFFVAPELQHLESPAPGPWVGQPSTAIPPVPVDGADIERLADILGGYGLEGGSGGPVENGTPLRNVFGRLDLALPEWDGRTVVSVNYTRTRNTGFSRDEHVFPLTSFAATSSMTSWTTSLQLNTALPSGGGNNELLVSRRWGSLNSVPEVQQPIVRVVAPSTSGDEVTIVTGTPDNAQGGSFGSWTLDLKDTITLPIGASHELTLGLEAERLRIERGGLAGSFGDWTFSSLDSLEAGLAERFVIRRDFGSASVPLRGGQYAAYAGDRWEVGDRLSITMGLRADVLAISGNAPYNAEVDSIFGRRTDEGPPRHLHLSPRLGFTWDLSDTGLDQLRGGIGIFTGRPPLAWIHSSLANYGVGIGVLRCGSLPNDFGPPPPFVADHRAAPTACASGAGLSTAPRGDVDLLDGDLRMARTLRGSLAYDRQLPGDLFATAEALATRTLSDFVFVNLNLEGPQAVDRFDRVLYGAINSTGLAVPVLRSTFSEVIDLRNTSRNHAVQLATRLEKRFSRGSALLASYTYSRVRDVQTPIRVNVPGTVNWSSRAVSGRHEDLDPEISLNDIPHRIVLAGTYRAPWRRWATEFSFYYIGESGSPFTYRSWGVGRRGDLNADGSNTNDPIYVPRDAFDPDEITFSGRSDDPDADNSPEAQAERVGIQQAAFERLIQGTECLRRQRGRILERNSCREPLSHTTIASVRQSIPTVRGALEAELQVFNVLNLLSGDWGRYRVADPELLEHVAQTPGPPEESLPIFRFDATAPEWTTLATESAFQLQLALRYRF